LQRSAQQTASASSEKERIARLEKQIEELREKLKIPGISAAIVKDQKLLWAKGFGHADIENKVPATPETNYRLASVTKTFGSMLLMQLVEQGKLDLDEPMSKYSPEFQKRFKNDAVKIRHVFTHTSHDTPGENYRYDGDRFYFLTDVIEKASGKSFRELLVKNILDKVDMRDSVPGPDILDDRTKWSAFLDADHAKRYEAGLAKLVKPYWLTGEDIVESVDLLRNINASAGLVSNALDLAKYDTAIDRHEFIKAETQERAWTPAVSTGGRTLPYGLGWFVQQRQGLRLIWHNGNWYTYSSLYLKVPEKKISFILLANSNGLSAPFSLGYGDVTESAFANSFLRIFIYEDALGRALPDPLWSHPNDQFKTEVEQLVKQAGAYRYEAELVSHNSLSRWLEERRKSARKVIKLDPKIYDQYVGQYEVEPGKAFTITKENDRLFINDAGRPKIQAFPESEERFFFTPMETRLTFIRDSKGLVTHAEFEDASEFRGQRIRATKVK
jgi:CubicO group peptidase (beta-lactamase class C family)